MNYDKFREEIEEKYGDDFSVITTLFFKKAIELADDEKYEDAIKVGRDALVMANYSNIGYSLVYLLGMLCQAYLDNNQPEEANEFFTYGIELLDKNMYDYNEDVDRFLDLKIIIDNELAKKQNKQ
jgi:hypothetical protein